MNDRAANIDVVFRNGLKDFEVLPPAEVWDNIQPLIRRKQRPFILIRAAALITIVLSVSFLAFWFSRETSAGLESSVLAINEESVFPADITEVVISLPVTGLESNIIPDPQITISDSTQEIANMPVKGSNTSPTVALLQETKGLMKDSPPLLKRSRVAALNSSQSNIFNIEEPGVQDLPESDLMKGTDRWTIAALASPTYYSRFNSGNDELTDQLIATEQPLISYSGGVAFSYKVNRRFSIQSGLFFSSVGKALEGINSFGGFQKYDYTKGDHNFEVLTSNGTVYTNNADVFLLAEGPGERIITKFTNDFFDPQKANLQYINDNLQQNFSYLELPVILRYKFIDKIIDFNLIGGLSYNVLVNNSVFTMVDGTRYNIGKTDGLNLMTLSSSIGMGMEYTLSNNLSLNLEPTFRYFLNSFNKGSATGMHPYSFGIFSGISYKF